MKRAIRILLVDDDPIILEVLSGILREEGYKVWTASRGQEGLQAIRESLPHLVILDVVLPDISGLEVCRKIKADPALQNIFVVLFSGNATDPAQKSAGLDIGADEYISKPVNVDEFLARIRTMVRLSEATRALRASEQHYRKLVEILPDAVILLGPEGRLTGVNAQAVLMLGYENAPELLQKSVFELSAQPVHERLKAEIEEAMAAGQLRNSEAIFLKKGGQPFPVELSATVVHDARGQPSGLLAVMRDITERRRSEETVRASEERFRQLAESIREVFWMTDSAKEEMLYISPGYEEIWGRTCQSLYASPRSWIDAIHPEDRERVTVAALNKQQSGDYDEVYRIIRPDRSVRWIQDRAFPVRDKTGEVRRVVGIAEDISERKLAEEAVLQSDARKSAIMEAALDGIITFDYEGRINEFNAAAEKMIGCNRSRVQGQKIGMVLVPLSLREWFQRGLTQGFAGDEGPVLGARIEMTVVRADGNEFAAEITITEIKQGGPPAFTAFLRDLTTQKRAEAELVMLAHAVQSTTEPICITDLNDRITFINRGFQQTYGYSEREILGQTPEILFSPNNPPCLMLEILAQTRKGGWRGEVLDLRKDGSEFPVLLSTSQITDRTGRILGLMGVAQDIEERKRAEEQIRLLADAMQSAHEMISITDHENRFTFVNQAFMDAYGYSAQEVLGKTPDFLYSPNNPPGLCEQVFRQTLLDGWNGELLNCRKGGSEFPIFLGTSQIKSNRGKILGLVGVARDITLKRKAEKENAILSLLGHRLSAAGSPEEAAKIILGTGWELFGWDAGYMHLYSEQEDAIVPILTIDTIDGDRVPVPSSNFTLDPSPMMREVMKNGARLINRENEECAGAQLTAFGDKARPSASMMYVPIRFGGEVLGLLSIQSYKPRAYSEVDLRRLQDLADHCGNALQRIKAAEALREAEGKYRSIFENSTEGIFQTTPQGRYLSANPALAQMLGYGSAEELIFSIEDVAAQTYVDPEKREELKRLLETQESVRDFEAERVRQDGERFWMSINCHAVRDGNGKILHYEGTNQEITARKIAETVLRESEEKFRAFFEFAPIGVALHNAEGKYLQVNRAYQAMLGYTQEELVQLGVRRITFPEDIPKGRELFGEFRNGKRDHYQRDKRYLAKNGNLVWAQSSASAVRDDAGKLRYIISMVEDITQYKWAENLLQAQRDFGIFLSSTNNLEAAMEKLLRVAMLSVGLDCGGVYLVDLKARGLYLTAHEGLSPRFVKRASQFALARGRVSKQGTTDGISGQIVGIREQLKREGVLATEAVPIRHAEEVVAVLMIGSRVREEIPAKARQAIEAIAALAGGAIARIRAEQSLSANRQLLEKTLHSLDSAVFLIDARTVVIQECNVATTQIFGYPRDEIVGRKPNFLHLDNGAAEEFQRHLDSAIKEKGVLSEYEFRMRRKDGTPFPTEHSMIPIKDDAGCLLSWVSVIRDITNLKRAQEELRQSSRLIIEAQEAERLRVARELHDGVNQIIASAKMRLSKVEKGLAGLKPAAREIIRRCDGLLVEALEENRRIAHNLRPSDLDELGLATACRNFCRELQSRGNMLVECKVKGLGQRFGPAVELNLFRIVQEALNNVEKHARAKTACLEMALKGDSILLKIEDDGRGYDPARRRVGKGKWRGIGLTNMRERAAALGGTCEITSVPKKGTTVKVRVPLNGAS